MAALDEIQLLLAVAGLVLVVLVDDAVAGPVAGPGVDPERPDIEVLAYRPKRAASIRDLVDLVEMGDGVVADRNPPRVVASES